MGDISSTNARPETLLILTFDPVIPGLIDDLTSRFPGLVTHHFCLGTASKQLLDESRVQNGWNARYIFGELVREDRKGNTGETRSARERLRGLLHDATIFVTLLLLPPERSMMPNVRLIHLLSAGADGVIDNPFFRDIDIDFTTSSGIHGVPLGEWTMMAVLSFRKHRLVIDEMQKKHQWLRGFNPWADGTDLRGCRVGILGYGSIGREVARLFSAFGCLIIAYTAGARPDAESRKDQGYIVPGTGDPYGSIPEEWFSGTDKSSLHQFLAQGLDFLVLAIPLTPATKHFIGEQEIDVLAKNPGKKSHCFLINVARGGVVDQTAMIDALNGEKLAGAALDVATPEPLPSDSPLWDAKNTMISPHIGAFEKTLFRQAFDVLIANLERRARGERLLNLVSRRKGY